MVVVGRSEQIQQMVDLPRLQNDVFKYLPNGFNVSVSDTANGTNVTVTTITGPMGHRPFSYSTFITRGTPYNAQQIAKNALYVYKRDNGIQ